ncbi:hypothetical protein BH23GEM9_BH23GEM9_34030 [soil metagenome]
MPRAALTFLATLTAVVAVVASSSSASGQIVKGQVVLAGTEQPLSEVLVRLRFPDGREAASFVTDSSGNFRLHAPRLGLFRLEADRLGMASVSSPELRLNLSEEVEVELQMSPEAVPLDPLTVKARSAIEIGLLAGYYERIERQQLLGAGHIITRDRIEERQAIDVADLLREIPRLSVVQGPSRVPAIYFRGSRGQCTPKVYINGIQQNRGGPTGSAAVVDEIVRPHELEGVEVYRGVSEMPGEFYDEAHCGVILLWTRRDSVGGRAMSWRRILIFGLGIGGIMYLLMR